MKNDGLSNCISIYLTSGRMNVKTKRNDWTMKK